MIKLTKEQILELVTKTNTTLKKSAGQFHIPVNINLQNILIVFVLAIALWFTAEQKIKATYARVFPKIDWQNPPDIDMSFDRGRFGCYYKYLEQCSPKAIDICDEKFMK